MNNVKSIIKNRYVLVVLAFALGVLLVGVIRAASYTPAKGVHYHANAAVYINGQREPFKALNYYEEEAAALCSASTSSETETAPMSRVHMHGNVNDVVHVEDKRVTWGNFYTVLGWNVGKGYLASRDTVFQNDGQNKVTYVLNGKTLDNIANVTIADQDKLLVSYGSQSTDQIKAEYAQIKNNARQADQSKDPVGCGGSHTDTATLRDRLKHMY